MAALRFRSAAFFFFFFFFSSSSSFFFCSNAGCPRGPVHVHVRSGSSEAKRWQDPRVRVATSCAFDTGTLREWVEAAHLDEDISSEGLLAGHGDRTRGRLAAPA